MNQVRLGRNPFNMDSFIFNFILFSICFSQIISVFRAANIYNTSYIDIVINAVFLYIFLIMIIPRFIHLKFTYSLALMLVITVVSLAFGVIYNDFSRYIISDFINGISFVLLLVYIINSDIEKRDFHPLAKWLTISLSVSLLIYSLFPLIGIEILSVGKTSIMFLFPIVFYYTKKRYYLMVYNIVLILLASKRALLLSLLITFIIVLIVDRKNNVFIRIILLTVFILCVIFLLFYTMTPERVFSLPPFLHDLFYKFMIVNPFSAYSAIFEDYRILEIKNSLNDVKYSFGLLFSGMGPGYVYDIFTPRNELIEVGKHNSHFTPVSLLTKFGLVYVIILYMNLIRVMFKSLQALYSKVLDDNEKIFCMYVIAAFINSFTAFTFFIDYLFILCFGILLKMSFQFKRKNSSEKF
ncbi:hypothetical protein [Cytobacillus dafuensis]|uniref:O-antigen ligase family protein n=1 Tax=Cytobacillus dafuensis TaxID=1742359 RepID=A0A5B8Z8H9_CYTDA|nr:hypothetical protein [Cytobacillus dafuensis]QED49191.1 hypothetical protein FSZ17_19095 [Cytobacillus dafuensis]